MRGNGYRKQAGVWAVLRRPGVQRRSIYVALVVGPVLTLINQYDVLIGVPGEFSWLKFALSTAVPYIVATIGAVTAATEEA